MYRCVNHTACPIWLTPDIKQPPMERSCDTQDADPAGIWVYTEHLQDVVKSFCPDNDPISICRTVSSRTAAFNVRDVLQVTPTLRGLQSVCRWIQVYQTDRTAEATCLHTETAQLLLKSCFIFLIYLLCKNVPTCLVSHFISLIQLLRKMPKSLFIKLCYCFYAFYIKPLICLSIDRLHNIVIFINLHLVLWSPEETTQEEHPGMETNQPTQGPPVGPVVTCGIAA